MGFQLLMRLVKVAFHRGVFDGAIHVSLLSGHSWATHLREATLDSMGMADMIKRNAPIPFGSLAYGKPDAVVRQDRVDCMYKVPVQGGRTGNHE